MNSSERQMKTRKEHFYSLSVNEIVDRANDLISQYPHLTLDMISIEVDYEYGESYTSFDYATPETDAEMNRRIADEKRTADYRRRQYEQLKKEFEE